MLKGAFLRSTLRQPLKTVLLLILTGMITFAFVSRVSEYLLVKQETDRLVTYYRATGTLQSVVMDRWADASEATAYLEANPYVQTVNTFHHTSAVMEETFCNADTDCNGPGKPNCNFYFYGTLLDWDNDNFYFAVDTVLSGYPEVIGEGQRAALFRDPLADNRLLNEEARSQLERGARYLARGYYRPKKYPRCRVETETLEPGSEMRTTYAVAGQVAKDGLFYPAPADREINWSDPRLAVSKQDIQISFDE